MNTTKMNVDSAYDLHIGVLAEKVEAYKTYLYRFANEIYTDGDGWEVWGDKIGTAGNDDTTAHVILRFPSVVLAIVAASKIMQDAGTGMLIPMREQSGQYNNGILVAVTRAADWADTVVDVCQEDTDLGEYRWRFTATTEPFNEQRAYFVERVL